MPPLCTAGFGLATGHFLYFLGAFYLFFINTVFIALATYLGVRFMGFAKKSAISTEQKKKAQKIITGLVVVTMIPAVFMTVGIVKRSIFEHNLRNFMKQELTLPGTHIISNEVDKDAKTLKVVAVGKEISMATQKEAEDRMEFYHLGGYKLTVIQGEQSDSILLLNNKLSNVNTNREEDRRQIAELTAKIGAVNAQLHSYTQYENSSVEIKDELKALYAEWLENKENGPKSRELADKIIPMLDGCCDNEACKQVKELSGFLAKRSQWIIGGDGASYDIGFGQECQHSRS